MIANNILLQRKYTRLIQLFAQKADIEVEKAMDKFYHSKTYNLISHGKSDLHCRSDLYLVDELLIEFGYMEDIYY